MTAGPPEPADAPDDVPPDTDTAIWREVTTFRDGQVISELTKIRIRQP